MVGNPPVVGGRPSVEGSVNARGWCHERNGLSSRFDDDLLWAPSPLRSAFYLDTSAPVKLVVSESETAALRSWLGGVDRDLVASDLARTELMSLVRRVVPDRAPLAREVLDTVTLMEVTSAVFTEAGRLDSPTLRSLDAIHLAVALDLGGDLEGLVTYGERSAAAAVANGVAVVTPN